MKKILIIIFLFVKMGSSSAFDENCVSIIRFKSVTFLQTRLTDDNGSFQVLDCADTWTAKNTLIKRFDRITKDETIRIENNGYCILVHSSGEAIELSGNRLVSMKDLILLNGGGTGEFPTAPTLEALFNPTPDKASRAWGAEPFWTLPWSFRVVLGPEDDLCLSWEKTRADNYMVTVTDLYSEPLFNTFITETNEFVMSNESLEEIPSSIKEIKIDVHDGPRSIATGKVTINRDTRGRSFFRCSSSAFQAVMLAHLLEKSGRYEAAGNYYRLAVSRSSLPVYKEFLRSFASRMATLQDK